MILRDRVDMVAVELLSFEDGFISCWENKITWNIGVHGPTITLKLVHPNIKTKHRHERDTKNNIGNTLEFLDLPNGHN
ncbi:hypothetical protein QQP08_011738 [Theobroma cacao]|nr:hypothetical protein QQP08_011738 [Theobroma cacao]